MAIKTQKISTREGWERRMSSNITISIKDFCDAMRRSFENERDILADRKELELQAKASGINVSAAKKWLKAEVFDDGVQNPKRVVRLIEQTIDQVVYGESLGHDLGMLQNNESRPHIEVRNTSKFVGPHSQGATARGEADANVAPRASVSSSPTESQVGKSGFTSPIPDPVSSFAGTEGEQTGAKSQAKASEDGGATEQGQESPADSVTGDASRASGSAGSANAGSASNLHVSTTVEPGFNYNPASSSPPEPGGDGVASSRASSPTNPDDFDPVRDMPAHLRDRPWESTGT